MAATPVARLVTGRNGAAVAVEVKRRLFTSTQTGTEAATGVAEKAAAWRGPQCRDPNRPSSRGPRSGGGAQSGCAASDRDRQGRGDWGDLSRFAGDGGRSGARAGRNRRGRCERCGGREPIRAIPRPWRPHVWVACALARRRARARPRALDRGRSKCHLPLAGLVETDSESCEVLDFTRFAVDSPPPHPLHPKAGRRRRAAPRREDLV